MPADVDDCLADVTDALGITQIPMDWEQAMSVIRALRDEVKHLRAVVAGYEKYVDNRIK